MADLERIVKLTHVSVLDLGTLIKHLAATGEYVYASVGREIAPINVNDFRNTDKRIDVEGIIEDFAVMNGELFVLAESGTTLISSVAGEHLTNTIPLRVERGKYISHIAGIDEKGLYGLVKNQLIPLRCNLPAVDLGERKGINDLASDGQRVYVLFYENGVMNVLPVQNDGRFLREIFVGEYAEHIAAAQNYLFAVMRHKQIKVIGANGRPVLTHNSDNRIDAIAVNGNSVYAVIDSIKIARFSFSVGQQ